MVCTKQLSLAAAITTLGLIDYTLASTPESVGLGIRDNRPNGIQDTLGIRALDEENMTTSFSLRGVDQESDAEMTTRGDEEIEVRSRGGGGRGGSHGGRGGSHGGHRKGRQGGHRRDFGEELEVRSRGGGGRGGSRGGRGGSHGGHRKGRQGGHRRDFDEELEVRSRGGGGRGGSRGGRGGSHGGKRKGGHGGHGGHRKGSQ